MFQFPFKCKYTITQGYADNANNYPEGHHGALDIVPFNDLGMVFPAPIYPLYAGSELSIQDTDSIKGKGVKERISLDKDALNYFIKQGLVPQGTDQCYLDVLYWHMLDVTDKDGTLELDTPIGQAGNTGNVYHDGQPVPDNQKGIPPYLGLHLHLETVLTTGLTTFNLDKDPRGRIDPQLIFNYKTMANLIKKTLNLKGQVGVFVTTDDPSGLALLNSVFGTNLQQQPDGTIPTDEST